jgi:hypothetical protein
LKKAILDRISFHGGLKIQDMVENFDSCRNTIVRHVNCLQWDGQVKFDKDRDWVSRII